MNAMSKATQAATIDDLRMHFFVPGRAETRIQGQISERPREEPQAHREPEKEIMSDQDLVQVVKLVLENRRQNEERRKSWVKLEQILGFLVMICFLGLFAGFATSSPLIIGLAGFVGAGCSIGVSYASRRGGCA